MVFVILKGRLILALTSYTLLNFREEFRGVVMSLEKILRDGRQQAKGGSAQATTKQLQLRVGVKPSLADCLDGIKLLHEMHLSEYVYFSSL